MVFINLVFSGVHLASVESSPRNKILRKQINGWAAERTVQLAEPLFVPWMFVSYLGPRSIIQDKPKFDYFLRTHKIAQFQCDRKFLLYCFLSEKRGFGKEEFVLSCSEISIVNESNQGLSPGWLNLWFSGWGVDTVSRLIADPWISIYVERGLQKTFIRTLDSCKSSYRRSGYSIKNNFHLKLRI